MKTRLLKKIRKRFKWKYDGGGKWTLFDSKATCEERIPDKNGLCFEWNWFTICSLTFAEEITSRIDQDLVKKHRQNYERRKNKSFVKKHFK